MTQVSPQPDCVFPPDQLPKSVGEMMHYLGEETPLMFLTPFAKAYYVLNKAWRLGWTFRNCKDARFIALTNPLGSGAAHSCNEGACGCMKRRFYDNCSHSTMILLAGGVQVVRQVLCSFNFAEPYHASNDQ